ncbi:MAG: hypothetical protein GQ523_03095 [Methanophagales archaeon]|nr:hypothetical protein [Methanophagales archaeon]
MDLVNQAEIHRKSISIEVAERREAVNQLRSNRSVLPDKKQAWDDLIRLAKDKDNDVRWAAADSLSSAFCSVWDDKQAWDDLIRLIKDKDYDMWGRVAMILGYTFQFIPYKKQAWDDLHQLTVDTDDELRRRSVGLLGTAFPDIPDKKQAWDDLIRLAKDRDKDMWYIEPDYLSAVIPHIPDKKQIWNGLHQLAVDTDGELRRRSAELLGTAFPHIPDKKQAWDDLIRLTKDKDRSVRIFANYSSGRVSIFKATEAESEEDFRKELENALPFFEKSSVEATWVNPARFCHLFYRSFYLITFKQTSEVEVQKYLAEAKSASKGSWREKLLLEAVENLANALREVQKVREMDQKTIKCDLNTYRRCCERAAQLLDTAQLRDFPTDKAPRAQRATKLIKMGLPIIDRRIKKLLNEIDKKTKVLCDAARGTEAEEYVNPSCKALREIIKIRNPKELDKSINRLIPNLTFMVENLPESERNFSYIKLENLKKEEYLEDKLSLVNEIIVFVIPYINMSKILEGIDKKLDDITISLEPGVHKELVITIGLEAFGTGVKEVVTIPQEAIDYPDLKEDLEKIKGKSIKLASLPSKLAKKVKDYLIRNKKDNLLKHLR